MKCHICGKNTTKVCDICSKPTCDDHMHQGSQMVGAIIPELGILVVIGGGTQSEHCEECCPERHDKESKRR